MAWVSSVTLLVCSCVLMLVLSAPPHTAAALSLRLHSSEFAVHDSVNMLSRLVEQSASSHCLLLTLGDRNPDATIRFTYYSNVTNKDAQMPLVVTVHTPTAPYAGTALLGQMRGMKEHRVFPLHELQQRSEDSEKGKPRMLELRVDAAPSTAADLGAVSKVLSGAYGVCFHLDRSHSASQSSPYQTANIQIHGISYTTVDLPAQVGSSSAGFTHGESQLEADASTAYERTMRKLYHVQSDEDVEEALRSSSLIGSDELQDKLRKLESLRQSLSDAQEQTRWQRERELDMRKTTESTFTRIWVATLLLMAAITFSVFFTTQYTASLIKKKKLI